MNRQYFDNLGNKINNKERLTTTQARLWYAYDRMIDNECDWIAIERVSDMDGYELVNIMKETNLNEIYIQGEWSNQFADWYEWQEAGLKMCGIVKVDNPKFIKQIQIFGESWERPTILLLKFSL